MPKKRIGSIGGGRSQRQSRRPQQLGEGDVEVRRELLGRRESHVEDTAIDFSVVAEADLELTDHVELRELLAEAQRAASRTIIWKEGHEEDREEENGQARLARGLRDG